MHLGTLLKKVHGSNHHLGQTPTKILPAEKKMIENLQELKIQLAQAIQVEDFEKAAEIRDNIREMENKGSDT